MFEILASIGVGMVALGFALAFYLIVSALSKREKFIVLFVIPLSYLVGQTLLLVFRP